jgi:hypothetical protein
MTSIEMSGGGRSKYDRWAKQGRKLYELVCITDGAVMQHWSEGPFPVDANGKAVPNWQSKDPSPSQAKLLAAVMKRTKDGLPVFYAKAPGMKVWDSRIGMYHDVPHITDSVKEAMKRHAEVRDQIAANARKTYDEKQRDMDRKINAADGDAVAALANALAQQIAGANAAPKAKSKGDA